MNELVYSRFVKHAKRQPHLPAIFFNGKTWSYGDVENNSNSLCNELIKKGVGAKDIVIVDSNRSDKLVVALIGVVKCGAKFLILGENHPNTYVKKVLNPIESFHWLSIGPNSRSAKEAHSIAEGKILGFLKYDTIHSECNHENGDDTCDFTATSEYVRNPDMYLSATSGSTGQPKLVLGTHLPVVHFLDWYINEFGFCESDRFSLLSGLGHDPLLRDIFTPLSCGASIWIPCQKNLNRKGGLGEWIKDQCISVVHTTPTLGEFIFSDFVGDYFPDLKMIAFGGGVLLKKNALKYFRLAKNCKILNLYGTTETPQAMAYKALSRSESHTLGEAGLSSIFPLGIPIEHVEITTEKSDGTICKEHEVGEICIRTRYLSKGYFNDPDLTSRVFVSNIGDKSDADVNSMECKYRTGDLGFYNAVGELQFVGRSDRQIKCRSNRIQLEEIELVLNSHEKVRHAAVVFQNAQSNSESIVCYIEFDGDSNNAEPTLKRHVLLSLPTYMLPDKFIFLDRMPINQNGKIDFSRLDAQQESLEYLGIRNSDLEKELTDIWSSVLNVSSDCIKMDRNFFEIGGNSLLATELVRYINDSFDRSISLIDIFVCPNIHALSELISNRTAVSNDKEILEDRNTKRQQRINITKSLQSRGKHE